MTSHLSVLQFGTTFEEMDALTGRHQTTKGIWLARSDKIAEPLTIVLDLEGSDGRERGEDDNSFERQSSLFALAIADVLLVNMWAKDVGREAGAGKPLLKTIFQVKSLYISFCLQPPDTTAHADDSSTVPAPLLRTICQVTFLTSRPVFNPLRQLFDTGSALGSALVVTFFLLNTL